ncbi:hypothetical protein SSP24_63070 [Streptomyces spinoverrucosus]|uniref:Uncharacterized protein n=1 Tax=Streptomyces spinoverrucosus TaxID=284043 RepID=A0A4Y3VNR1_9ACTN|nr:hypothetical protein [Streptomyces spinoverrucosus]GEC08652.1 hypothetical protein SSP24_63070 [Streptomyces spinoverrucosus]GHB53848.1 hypothetical protein GCM10010397_25030 [Streptomyces spinoverrucosus]
MTQSGQGEEPSARPAREGIVLPSDGGEPLLPGMTGGPADRPVGPQHGAPAGGPAPASAPPGGQAWGQPWGPGQHQAPAPPPGQDWQTPPAEPWGAQQQAHWSGQDQPGPLPPEGAPGQAYGGGAQASYDGGAQASYGAYGTPGQGAPAPLPAPGTSAPLLPAGHGAPGGSLPPAGYGAPGMPLPSADDGATQYIPPVAGASGDEGATQYIPPVGGAPYHAPDGATQYIPPVAGGPSDEGATQYLPPVSASASGDDGATQYIPPVGPGALPPEMPSGGSAHRPAETTTYLGRAQEGGAAAGPLPAAPGGDAEATQYIPPVPGQGAYGDRQPPAEFDNLFRSGPGADGGQAGATQYMPRYQGPQDAGHAVAQRSYEGPGPAQGRRASRDGEGRTRSKVPLIAACGIAIAVVGIGAGALLADGGGGGQNDDPKTVSAASPVPSGSDTSASPSADPAEQQAIALDKLLADSGASRATVINAVNDVKTCDNLAQAAKDLRGAAQQRNNLVTQLSGLTVDKLPDHAALTAALNKAWKASAAADNHYAAWADQVAGQKGKLCKKGQARSTGQTAAGNRESGVATTQKAEAAKLWNAIARKYGLTERQPTQL